MMHNLPLIPPSVFFAVMFALQAFDAFSTAKALRNGGKELNGPLRWIMKLIGVNQALFLAKGAYLIFLWRAPSVEAWEQWLSIAIYVAVAINNVRVLKKLGAI